VATCEEGRGDVSPFSAVWDASVVADVGASSKALEQGVDRFTHDLYLF